MYKNIFYTTLILLNATLRKFLYMIVVMYYFEIVSQQFIVGLKQVFHVMESGPLHYFTPGDDEQQNKPH